MSEDGFLSRWSRRKTQVARGQPLPETSSVAPPDAVSHVPTSKPPTTPTAAPEATRPIDDRDATPTMIGTDSPVQDEPPPTLDDAAKLTPQSTDFSRFVRSGVSPDVQHSALKTLFADPHFNVMDGLDVYIDDYSRPDPLPASMLRQMVQSRMLGLFDDEPQTAPALGQPDPAADPAIAPMIATTNENPDLQLQPDDAAGRTGPGPGAGEDTGRKP